MCREGSSGRNCEYSEFTTTIKPFNNVTTTGKTDLEDTPLDESTILPAQKPVLVKKKSQQNGNETR